MREAMSDDDRICPVCHRPFSDLADLALHARTGSLHTDHDEHVRLRSQMGIVEADLPVEDPQP